MFSGLMQRDSPSGLLYALAFGTSHMSTVCSEASAEWENAMMLWRIIIMRRVPSLIQDIATMLDIQPYNGVSHAVEYTPQELDITLYLGLRKGWASVFL